MSKNGFPKNCDDLFRKNFVHDNICQFNISRGQDKPVIKQSFGLDGNADLVGTFVNSLAYKKQNVTLTIGTDGNVSVHGTSPLPHPAASLNGSVKYKPVGPNKGATDSTLELVLKQAPLMWKGRINPIQKTWNIHTSADGKLKEESYFVAADVSGKMTRDVVSSLKPSITVAIKKSVQNNPLCFGGKLSHYGKSPFGKLSLFTLARGSDSELGCEYSYIRPEDRSEFTVGAQWFLPPASYSQATPLIKFKLDHQGKVAGAYVHPISSTAALTLGAQFDAVSKFKNDKDASTKFGIRLNLTA